MSKDAAIDGELLEQVHDELRKRSGKSNSITSRELSKQLDIDDGDAQPKTREAIRILQEERDAPIAAYSGGYFYMADSQDLEEYLDFLDNKIAGIEDRKQLATRSYNRWRKREAERKRNELDDDGDENDDADESESWSLVDTQLVGTSRDAIVEAGFSSRDAALDWAKKYGYTSSEYKPMPTRSLDESNDETVSSGGRKTEGDV